MAEFLLIFFIIVAVTLLALVLFSGWLIVMVVKSIAWLIGRATAGRGRTLDSPGRPCPHLRCRQQNPPQANFCRRCGRPLTETAPAFNYQHSALSTQHFQTR